MAERKVSKKAMLLWALAALFLAPATYFVTLGNQQHLFMERAAGIVLVLMSVALVRAAAQEMRQARARDLEERLRNSQL